MSSSPNRKSNKIRTKATSKSRSRANGGTLKRVKKQVKGFLQACRQEPAVYERALSENEGLGTGPSTYEQVANRSRKAFLEKYGNSTAKMMAVMNNLSDREDEDAIERKKRKERRKLKSTASDDDNREWLLEAFRDEPETPIAEKPETPKIPDPNENLSPDELTQKIMDEEPQIKENDEDEVLSVQVSVDSKPASLASAESVVIKSTTKAKSKANSGGRPSNGTEAAQVTLTEPDVAGLLKTELLSREYNRRENMFDSPPPPVERERRISNYSQKTTDTEEYQKLMAAFHSGDI